MFDYPVVFVDIETTGGSYRNSRVLEVAAIRYENSEVVREFSTLINPETYIPASITTLTGITSGDVVDVPRFEAIADELFEVLDGAVFVAHNVRFDYSFLKNEFSLVGLAFSPKMLCTVRLSRALYAEHKGHSLAKLIERHHIPVLARHRALDDARAILYFSQLAYDEHGPSVFQEALQRQLKTQYLPPNLNIEELNEVENVAGVYVFEDEVHQPLYVGKSINLKKRILSHFQDQSSKELKIAQAVHHVRTIVTGSELAALILESKMIKELSPIYNRMLRRISQYAMYVKAEQDGYDTIRIQSGNVDNTTDLARIYGLYETRTKAKRQLELLTRTFMLCPKLMGIEKGTGACFSYSLGRCKGACIGEESTELYNRRFEIAMEKNRIALWPYETAIAIPLDTQNNGVVIHNWMVQGFIRMERLRLLKR
ncbi:MAG: polC [Candidatus Saccharibacteria bacterium]|nr:polC [Candidatus Saccharibacteria bacterium]